MIENNILGDLEDAKKNLDKI